MRVLGRFLPIAFVGLVWLTLVALVALAAYVYYVALVGLFGPLGTVLIGVLYVTALAVFIYLARRRSRGKTEDEIYNDDWTLRSLTRIQNQGWLGSVYGLLPGENDRADRTDQAPPDTTHGTH